MRDSAQMKYRILIQRSVETRVITEWPFLPQLVRLYESLENKIHISRYLQITGLAFNQLD